MHQAWLKPTFIMYYNLGVTTGTLRTKLFINEWISWTNVITLKKSSLTNNLWLCWSIIRHCCIVLQILHFLGEKSLEKLQSEGALNWQVVGEKGHRRVGLVLRETVITMNGRRGLKEEEGDRDEWGCHTPDGGGWPSLPLWLWSITHTQTQSDQIQLLVSCTAFTSSCALSCSVHTHAWEKVDLNSTAFFTPLLSNLTSLWAAENQIKHAFWRISHETLLLSPSVPWPVHYRCRTLFRLCYFLLKCSSNGWQLAWEAMAGRRNITKKLATGSPSARPEGPKRCTHT